MRKTLLISAAVLGLAAAPAFAQSTTTDSVTAPMTSNSGGARPGNIPGTNNSLPLGTTASNIDPSTTKSEIAPHLPTPSVGDDGSVSAYLAAAQKAIDAHHNGAAQQALEMAETRALDRSTLAINADKPDQSPLVKQIEQALNTLGHKDMSGTKDAIGQALTLVTSQQQAAGMTKM